MKQIEYTEKQKFAIEIINASMEEIKSAFPTAYNLNAVLLAYEQRMYKKYGIIKRYLTLREYIKQISYGAYHRFYFTIGEIYVNGISTIEKYRQYYREKWLDMYYVTEDERKRNSEITEHHLTLVQKDD